jgi:hypothetical protein
LLVLLGVRSAGATGTRRSHALSKGETLKIKPRAKKARGEIAKLWLFEKNAADCHHPRKRVIQYSRDGRY